MMQFAKTILLSSIAVTLAIFSQSAWADVDADIQASLEALAGENSANCDAQTVANIEQAGQSLKYLGGAGLIMFPNSTPYSGPALLAGEVIEDHPAGACRAAEIAGSTHKFQMAMWQAVGLLITAAMNSIIDAAYAAASTTYHWFPDVCPNSDPDYCNIPYIN